MPDNQDLSEFSDQELFERREDYQVMHKEYLEQGDQIPDWLQKVIEDVDEEIEFRGLD